MDDLEFLWNRDNASQMDRPSIDRIDSKGHYVLTNCRFIELLDNIRRKRGVGKLNMEIAEEIRKVYKPRSKVFGAKALGKKYGVRRNTIGKIVNRNTYNYIPTGVNRCPDA
jgi:hypothetical protein